MSVALLLLVVVVAASSASKDAALWFAQRNVSIDAASVAPILTMILFVGYPRSSHSLVGAILDAHPRIVVAHELNLVARADSLRSRDELLKRIFKADHSDAQAGRQQSGYSYAIPGAWQGRWEPPLLVVGDKKGHGTTSSLQADWHGSLTRLGHLQSLVGGAMRFFHVLRNCYDNIATMVFYETLHYSSAWQEMRANGSAAREPTPWRADFERVVDEYIGTVETNMRFEQHLLQCERGGVPAAAAPCVPRARMLHVDGAELLRAPAATMRAWCEFVGVPFRPEWADAAAKILFREPYASRNLLRWPAATVRRVEMRLSVFAPFAELVRNKPQWID